MISTDYLKRKALELQIPNTRVASAFPLSFERAIPDFFKRVEPKSVIVSLQNYPSEPLLPSDPLYGAIAPFARSNYYRLLRKKQEKLIKSLKLEYGGSYYVSCNGSLREKPLAVRAGLGSYGFNRIISVPGFGSWIVLGAIVSDVEFKPDEPSEQINSFCFSCGLCVEKCPSKALRSDSFCREKCLQYLSQIPEIVDEAVPVWGSIFYGCSVCQSVCPLNIDVQPFEESSVFGGIGAFVYLPDIIFMTDDEIKERFRGTQLALSWISPEALIKNALIVLSQSAEGREFLYKFIKAGRLSLRNIAALLLERFA